MLDLYIKTKYFPAYKVKDWKIIRLENENFIQIENSDMLLPLENKALLFQDSICDFIFDDKIPAVLYDNGVLQYIYSLSQNDNILQDISTNGLDSITFPLSLLSQKV